MPITLSEVQKVAKLASLKISVKEADDYLKNLQDILNLANQMEMVPTESIPTSAHCFNVTQRLRSDEVTESNQRDRLQQLSEHIYCGLYCVPIVIE